MLYSIIHSDYKERMESIRYFILLCCLVWSGVCELDQDVCKTVTENFGYFPPDPPFSFIMKYRETNLFANDSKHFTYQFDATKQRVLVEETTNGNTRRSIFDYQKRTLIEIYETYLAYNFKQPYCTFIDLDSSYQWHIEKGLDKIRYGTENFRQIGKISNTRGMETVGFTGCDYKKYRKGYEHTVNVTYKWTRGDQLLAVYPFGISATPVYSHFFGYTETDGFTNEISKHRQIYWYQTNPTFREEDFSVPPEFFCVDSRYRGSTKKMPSSEKSSHSAKGETITQYIGEHGQPMRQVFGNFKIWKSFEHKLVREDYYTNNNVAEGLVFPNAQVSSVHDFNAGIAYITNLYNGKCQVVPISSLKGDPDVKDYGGIFKMAGSGSIFEKYTWVYKTQEKYRDLPIDVWMSLTSNEKFDNRESQVHMEVDYMLDDWNLYTKVKEPSTMPIRIREMIKFTDGKLPSNITTTANIYDVVLQEPDLRKFFLYTCFKNLPQKFISFNVNGTALVKVESALISDSRNKFHEAIAKTAQIDIMRVELTSLYEYEEGVYRITATLHDAPDIVGAKKTKSSKITAEMAAETIKKAVDGKSFEVDLKFSKFFSKTERIMGIPGSFTMKS